MGRYPGNNAAEGVGNQCAGSEMPILPVLHALL